jgi:hypothetical protein
MHWLVLCAGLAFGADQFEDGSLLFLENCNSVVQWTGDGKIGHVAMLFNDDTGQTWVYEATPGQIRKAKLAQYTQELVRLNARRDADDGIRPHVLRPKRPYTPTEVSAMQEFLDEQLGRRYSVRNYVRAHPGDGMHCAELTSSTLNQSGHFNFEKCAKIHPAELFERVSRLHRPAEVLDLSVELPGLTWCQRATLRWANCWTMCKWSCGEAWAWCW